MNTVCRNIYCVENNQKNMIEKCNKLLDPDKCKCHKLYLKMSEMKLCTNCREDDGK